ncbi:MAG: geranylgeranyl reductase family protein [Candidatus Methylomirabilales bacterium]
MDSDVIVAGGGPGGAMAALALAETGLRVLLLERAVFPRHKPCGGCLSPKVLSLGVDFREVVEDVATESVFTAPGEAPIRYRSTTPLAYMVQRERFDHLLLNQAEERGARALYGHRVLQAEEVSGGVEVVSDRGTFRASFLIGADGACGAVVRSFRRPPSRIALAMDARVSPSERVREAWRGLVLIDFGSVPFGYAWVFPKGHELATGVLGAKEKVRGLPGYLERFLDRQFPWGGPRRVTGWPIPYPAWTLNPLGGSRVLLVGDAAGFVDPFTGEGIYYAMRSGLLAAAAIAEGETKVTERYRRLIRTEFQREFRAAAVLAQMIHRAPELSFRTLRRHPEALKAFATVLTGESGYPAFLRRVVRGCLHLCWGKLKPAA